MNAERTTELAALNAAGVLDGDDLREFQILLAESDSALARDLGRWIDVVATPLPALDSSAVHSIVTLAGTFSTGSVVSITVIVWVALVAFPHSSVDVDEFIFYCKGNFTSRKGVSPGSMSYHPAGSTHGPHPGSYEASIGSKDTTELAVMLDCMLPLVPTVHVHYAVLADDLVAGLFLGVLVDHGDRGAEHDLVAVQLGHIDHLGAADLVLDVGDLALDPALTLFRGVIFSVFRKIAMLARFRDGRDHARPLHGLQLLQLIVEDTVALGRHRHFFHMS